MDKNRRTRTWEKEGNMMALPSECWLVPVIMPLFAKVKLKIKRLHYYQAAATSIKNDFYCIYYDIYSLFLGNNSINTCPSSLTPFCLFHTTTKNAKLLSSDEQDGERSRSKYS